MPKNDGSEQAELEQVIETDISRLQTSLKLAQGQVSDAYSQTRQSFKLVRNSKKALIEAQTVIEQYAKEYGRTMKVTRTLGAIERRIKECSRWLVEN